MAAMILRALCEILFRRVDKEELDRMQGINRNEIRVRETYVP